MHPKQVRHPPLLALSFSLSVELLEQKEPERTRAQLAVGCVSVCELKSVNSRESRRLNQKVHQEYAIPLEYTYISLLFSLSLSLLC